MATIMLLSACKKGVVKENSIPEPQPQLPETPWAITIGNDCVLQELETDVHGNVYVVGRGHGVNDMDPSPGVYNVTAIGDYSLFVAKYNRGRQLVFARELKFPVSDIAFDNDGNMFIVGSFGGKFNFDTGAGIKELTSYGSQDGFLAKYAPNGKLLFVRQIGTVNSDHASAVKVDSKGDVYIKGNMGGDSALDPGRNILKTDHSGDYIAKFSKNGILLLTPNVFYDYSSGPTLHVDDNDYFYLSGRVFLPGYIDDQCGILKYSPDGKIVSVMDLGSDPDHGVGSIIIDNSNNLWAGYRSNSEGCSIVKFDGNGKLIFDIDLQGENSAGIVASYKDNDIYMTGVSYGGGVDLKTPDGSYAKLENPPTSESNYRFFAKLNSKGQATKYCEIKIYDYRFAQKGDNLYLAGGVPDKKDIDVIAGREATPAAEGKGIYLVRIVPE
ncbi:MAG: hypothetical protein ABIN95_13335 [Mucilaginibacter sp.]